MVVQETYFRKIYDAAYDKVLSYVLAKCGKIDVEDIVQETYAELFEVLVKKGIVYIHCSEAFVMQLVKTKVHRYYIEKEYQRAWMFMEDFEAIEPDCAIGTEWEDVLIDKLTVQEIMEYISEKDELTKEIFYQHYFEG